MRTKHFVLTIALALTVAVLAVPAVEAKADPNIVVILRGTSGTRVAVPTGVNADIGCFKTDLYSAKTDRKIGTGIDCLDGAGAADGVSINRTTIFNFRQGTLVANGLTAVVPQLGGSAASPAYTHVVGDVDANTKNVIPGLSTGRFSGATGNVRLSGIVNLSNLVGAPTDTVEFNCIFVIDLD